MGIFSEVGVRPRVAQEAFQTNMTMSLVGAGFGCIIIMLTAALSTPRNVKFLRIEDEPRNVYWSLLMVWHPSRRSGLVDSLVKFAEAYVTANPHLLRVDSEIPR